MAPTEHSFRYRLFQMYLDLDELPAIFDGRLLWSARGPAPAWFRRSDYLGETGDLREAVRTETERQLGLRPMGPIRVLTHLRYFGFVMNPVTFYYCFSPDGHRVEAILAEITNTPWNERHTYALAPTSPDGTVTRIGHEFGKAFHISPFMEMDHMYAWRFSDPGERLTVHMENAREGRKVFDATLVLRREEIDSFSLARSLAAHPWMTARVAAAIYWQAARLWLKGTPFHSHPRRRSA